MILHVLSFNLSACVYQSYTCLIRSFKYSIQMFNGVITSIYHQIACHRVGWIVSILNEIADQTDSSVKRKHEKWVKNIEAILIGHYPTHQTYIQTIVCPTYTWPSLLEYVGIYISINYIIITGRIIYLSKSQWVVYIGLRLSGRLSLRENIWFMG